MLFWNDLWFKMNNIDNELLILSLYEHASNTCHINRKVKNTTSPNFEITKIFKIIQILRVKMRTNYSTVKLK